jgi:hypothetical protein
MESSGFSPLEAQWFAGKSIPFGHDKQARGVFL